MVLLPPGSEAEAPEVEAWVNGLKSERRRRRKSADLLPILRLLPQEKDHAVLLRRLGLTPAGVTTTHLCRSDSRGWPLTLIHSYSPGTTPREVFGLALGDSAVVARSKRSVPMLTSSGEVGLLLFYARDDEGQNKLVQGLLKELGRYWLERYGRARPAPYPLAYYDASDQKTVQQLKTRFPELLEVEPPVAALCSFQGRRPTEVRQRFHEFDTPASLVRRLSGSRSALLAEGFSETNAQEAPEPAALGLNSELETTLLVSRINETAQQLWDGLKDSVDETNRGSLRVLIQVSELSRQVNPESKESLIALKEALRDYQVEPLILPDSSRLQVIQGRFQELIQILLASP